MIYILVLELTTNSCLIFLVVWNTVFQKQTIRVNMYTHVLPCVKVFSHLLTRLYTRKVGSLDYVSMFKPIGVWVRSLWIQLISIFFLRALPFGERGFACMKSTMWIVISERPLWSSRRKCLATECVGDSFSIKE